MAGAFLVVFALTASLRRAAAAQSLQVQGFLVI
jgi:hypothetical protein